VTGEDRLSSKTAKTASAKSAPQAALDWRKHADDFLWMRETIESIVVAFLLAFLFRTFEAEPFVIPTGSMAPTLLGAHKDIYGEKTGYRAAYNTSGEFPEVSGRDSEPTFVLGVVDPMSRYPEAIDEYKFRNHDSFCGDRILVSKFVYDFTEPRRWDVIVFKYPNDAKVNYIKRLIGLPDESIRVTGGDIWAKERTAPEGDYRIQRKPDPRLLAMLQVVDDNKYVAAALQKVAWPSKWQSWIPGQPITANRSCEDDKNGLMLKGSSGSPQWFRYYQILPLPHDWFAIDNGKGKPADVNSRIAEPITDFVAYNATYDTQQGYDSSSMTRAQYREYSSRPQPSRMYLENGGPVELDASKLGDHWVGDLAVEVEAKVESDAGALILDLVKNGEHFQCRIDIANGGAQLSRTKGDFQSDDGAEKSLSPSAKTSVRGKGTYRIRYTNIDDELRLWVNGYRVTFDAPTTYQHQSQKLRPHFTDADPLDLAPIGIGAEAAEIQITHARVLRDIYYSATTRVHNEYDTPFAGMVRSILLDPTQWQSTDLFANTNPLDIELLDDQFLPMGDNSAQSLDGRYWGHVDRDLLVGKALMVYWTHPWSWPPFWPEFGRIRFIR
jgi:signal peptidase I